MRNLLSPLAAMAFAEDEEDGGKERERRRGGTKVSSGRWRGANSDTELGDLDGDISEFLEDFNSDEEPDDCW